MADTNPEAKFALKLSGDGINVDREIDRDIALRVLNIVLGDRGTIAPTGTHGGRTVTGSNGRVPLSLREYLDEAQPTRKPDQIVTIAHFVCEHEGAEDFSREEVRSRFPAAREPIPANFARDFAWTLKNGWIAEVPGKNGRYYVTAKGIQAVESRFSAEVKKATASTKGSARRR